MHRGFRHSNCTLHLTLPQALGAGPDCPCCSDHRGLSHSPPACLPAVGHLCGSEGHTAGAGKPPLPSSLPPFSLSECRQVLCGRDMLLPGSNITPLAPPLLACRRALCGSERHASAGKQPHPSRPTPLPVCRRALCGSEGHASAGKQHHRARLPPSHQPGVQGQLPGRW